MNKYLCVIGLVITFLGSEGCRRNRMLHSTGPVNGPTSSADSTITVRPTPSSSADTAAVGRPIRPDNEEARPSVAEIDFQYLTAKSKISFKSPSQDIDNANLNIRVQKDSLIWLSVSKLGIESGRGLITHDSITIIDRFTTSIRFMISRR